MPEGWRPNIYLMAHVCALCVAESPEETLWVWHCARGVQIWCVRLARLPTGAAGICIVHVVQDRLRILAMRSSARPTERTRCRLNE